MHSRINAVQLKTRKSQTKAERFTVTNQDGYKKKFGKNVHEESDGVMRSEDENSKSSILEELSFSSEESTFESVPPQGKKQKVISALMHACPGTFRVV